jgi:short-subunit dehydrogenase
MALQSSPKSILITGATGGIGGALALAYAVTGVTLFLQGRDQQKLASLATRCRAQGATVETQPMDVRDIAALQSWVRAVDARAPLDLVIPCAGININTGPDHAGERWEEIDALIDINIRAAFATVDAALTGMRLRKRGQIALFSSLAGYFGLPVTPSYCASKAAIRAYGEALRGGLAPHNIGVTVVMPGFVESYMCEEMPGPKPFLWTAEKAARVIKRGITANRARISFPFPLNVGCWSLSVLPASVSQRLVKLFDFGG